MMTLDWNMEISLLISTRGEKWSVIRKTNYSRFMTLWLVIFRVLLLDCIQ